MSNEFFQRFQSRIDKQPGGCWLWTAGKDRKGYGAISFEGRMLKAHRVAWELNHNEPPPFGVLVCHACDTPACVNPRHLFLGTPADNSADMVRKGRHRVGVRHRGEANKATRIQVEAVREIRELRKAGLSLRAIAARVGISNGQVGNIVSGKHWGWVR